MRYLTFLFAVFLMASNVQAWPHAIKPGGGGGASDPNSQHGNGANCVAGEIPLGVDAVGAVEGCYEPAITDVTGFDPNACASGDFISDITAAGVSVCGTPAGGGGGDDITVENGFANPVDPQFSDTVTIDFTGADLATDEVTADVNLNSLDFTELENVLNLDNVTGDPARQDIVIIDNQTLRFLGTDSGTTGPAGAPIEVNLTYADDADGLDTRYGFNIVVTNDNDNVDGDSSHILRIRTEGTASNGIYETGIFVDHGENFAGTMEDGIRVAGNTAGAITDAIDVSGAGITNALNVGANPIIGAGQLTIGSAASTSVVLATATGNFLYGSTGIVLATGAFIGRHEESAGDIADFGIIRLLSSGVIGWEADTPGVDIRLSVDSTDTPIFTSAVGGIGLVTTTATECITFMPGDATGVADTDLAGTNFGNRVLSYSNSADDQGYWNFPVPDNLTGTLAAVTVYWVVNNGLCDGGASADVCWTLDGDSFADDAVYFGGTMAGTLVSVTDTCGGTTGDLNISTLPSFTHSMTAGELGVLEIARDIDGTDGAGCNAGGDDDLAAFADLISVKFCYEVNNVFSGE